MRFMMLMIPNVTEDDWAPDAEAVAAMGAYNEELAKAGKLIALDGLHPTGEGARVSFAAAGQGTAVDGPFSEAKEVVGGYWMIEADSREDAVEWALRCPAAQGDVIEVRRVYEMSDFPADVQEAAKTDLL
ncbi:MAG: YciI family protein [Solirubrobacteraceae bacterium]|nr:YciI family protein [Solirubrobacteraceae bacterium]